MKLFFSKKKKNQSKIGFYNKKPINKQNQREKKGNFFY